MAFEGDLSNLSLGDVLQTIAGSRQVGTFIIRGVEERRLACDVHGVALVSARSSLGLLIGSVLVGTEKITSKQLDDALRAQRRRRESPIGGLLVEAGACTPDDVREARRYVALEEIFELFMWREGTFEFVAGNPQLGGLFCDLWFEVPSLAMEAARRLDELPRAMQTAPQNEEFVRVENVEEKLVEIADSRDLRALLALVNGARTVEDVRQAYYRGRFDTWKGMEALVERGLLRPAIPEEVLAAAQGAVAAKDFARAARLYSRAAEHAPADESIEQSIADCLRDAGEKRRAAETLVHLGAARLERGAHDAALESLSRAIALDAGSPDAHEAIAHALGAVGRADEATTAALAAAAIRMGCRDFEGALRVVEWALAQSPRNPEILSASAAALHGLGRLDDAMRALEEAARILTDEGVKDERLIDVLRRIVQLDPSRKDCETRIDEIRASAATRKKRIMQRVAIAAGILVVGAVAVPIIRGPSVESRIAKIHSLVDEMQGDATKAQTALRALDGLTGAAMSGDEKIDVDGLRRRVDHVLHPPDGAGQKQKVDAALDLVYRATSAAVQEGRLADGLAGLLAGLDQLDGPDARKLQTMDEALHKQLLADAAHEVDLALSAVAAAAQKESARVASVRDRFDANVWKREDLDVLHDLVDQSGQVVEATKGDSWTRLPELVKALVAKTHAPSDASDKRILEATAVVVDGAARVAELHDRALLRARRKELKEGFVSTYADGAQLRRQGRLEEALQRYGAFLAKCEELKSAAPAALYEPVLKELFGGEMMLDQRIRTERDDVAAIVRVESEAAKAEADVDFETAFRLCKRLVHDHPDIDFTRRFQMPLRIETAPAGAEVILVDASKEARSLGRTPLSTHYPIATGAKYELRLPGYADWKFAKKGAAEDSSGVERVELPKTPLWKSAACGSTEAPASATSGSILVAGRDGVIRRLDAKTGVEAARFAPGLLDGFACPVVARGGLVFAAALDGKGWILKLSDLSLVATFDTGAVRGALVPTARGVIVADEAAGVVRLIGDDGKPLWTAPVGKVKADPSVDGDLVVVVDSDGEIFELSASSGAVTKRRKLRADSTWGAPTIRNGRIVLGDASGDVACLDATSLADAWTRTLGGPVRGRICATDLRVVACTGDGAVHVLDAETGSALAAAIVGDKADGARGACDLPDGGFVLVTKKGIASRYDAKGGLVWKYDAAEEVLAPPRLLDGVVVVVTKKGVAVALDP